MKIKVLVFALAILSYTAMGVFQEQCFIPGECVNSYSIEILSLVDEYECLANCKDQVLCEWFTFFLKPSACQLFRNCTFIDEESCNDCLSGQRGCEVPEPLCWIPGECEGNIIKTEVVESSIDCLRFCNNEAQCKWFTFLEPGKMCFLFSDCETFDETTEGCISGERRCQEDVTTTTTMPTHTTIFTTTTTATTTVTSTTTVTTSTTATTTGTTTTATTTVTTTTTFITTASPVPVYSKVFVSLGENDGVIADVEIIDLLSSETTCQKPENFPYAVKYASGGLGFQEKPLICGGDKNTSACNVYEDGAWKSSDSLKQGRYRFAMTKSPFQNGSSKLFLTGGYNGSYLNTSEVLTENGWQVSVPLPVTINDHCMVKVNLTSVMVIGGHQNRQYSGRSFLFNSETNIWTEGPTLNTPRRSHSCGSIRKNSQTEQKSLIAIGGFDRISIFSSVEVLDLDSKAWRRGPKLPFGICYAAMVEDPSGGVVLIGGYNEGIGDLDTLYRLPHAGSDATWELMTQKLKTNRRKHTAFLIPDDIAACN